MKQPVAFPLHGVPFIRSSFQIRSICHSRTLPTPISARVGDSQRPAPEIFNTDQGRQFTGRLQAAGVRISMDGRGRCMDNIFIERRWCSLKYEAVYLHALADGFEGRRVIDVVGRLLQHRKAALGARWAPPGRGLPQAQQQRQKDLSRELLAV